MEKLNSFHSLYHTGRRRSRRFVSKRSVAAVRFWRSLTFSQRCYFIASCMLLVWMYSDFESKIYLPILFMNLKLIHALVVPIHQIRV